jgi:hypothetical protein
VRGEVIRPADAGYDAARALYNAMIDKRPALIVRCPGVADVVAAVGFAREHELAVAVRGGGHNVAGKAMCDGGLVIDLSPMRGVRVDPGARTARAQSGVLWGELDRATQRFGLATTGGTVSTTGIAGLTLGGGLGRLMGKHGLSCDNLLSVDVVTADGRVVTASAEENQNLYWAMRGGGANFGVATSFRYRLHPVGTVLGGMLLHPLARAEAVLRFYRGFAAEAPDELTTFPVLLTSPDGHPMLAVLACYAGPIETGERVRGPLRAFGRPLADQIRPAPYAEVQAGLDPAFPPGLRNYWKSNFLTDFSDAIIDALVSQFGVPGQAWAGGMRCRKL